MRSVVLLLVSVVLIGGCCSSDSDFYKSSDSRITELQNTVDSLEYVVRYIGFSEQSHYQYLKGQSDILRSINNLAADEDTVYWSDERGNIHFATVYGYNVTTNEYRVVVGAMSGIASYINRDTAFLSESAAMRAHCEGRR